MEKEFSVFVTNFNSEAVMVVTKLLVEMINEEQDILLYESFSHYINSVIYNPGIKEKIKKFGIF